jgi:hypothetical protein
VRRAGHLRNIWSIVRTSAPAFEHPRNDLAWQTHASLSVRSLQQPSCNASAQSAAAQVLATQSRTQVKLQVSMSRMSRLNRAPLGC